jgi:hypothetical protein
MIYRSSNAKTCGEFFYMHAAVTTKCVSLSICCINNKYALFSHSTSHITVITTVPLTADMTPRRDVQHTVAPVLFAVAMIMSMAGGGNAVIANINDWYVGYMSILPKASSMMESERESEGHAVVSITNCARIYTLFGRASYHCQSVQCQSLCRCTMIYFRQE